MTLYALSIRRPVLATVMSLVIVIFGILSFFYLGVREYPAVDRPVISVSTTYRGANADVIDSQITEPIEESVNGIEGIRTITSVSREGRSTITVEFELGADLERAANDVRDRVSRAMRLLPVDVEPPVISKADADGQPILFLGVASDRRNLLDLTEVAENLFKERLQTIPGVSRVDIWGSKRYAMRMWLDPQRLAAHSLTPLDVQTAVARSNVELPSGRIEGDAVELTIRTMGRLSTPDEFENLILHEEGGHLVRFRDVGRVELGPENERTVLKRDGVPMVGVVLRPLPGANYISIVDEFYNRLEWLEKDVPPDITLEVGFDTTEQIRTSISEVQQTIFIAFLLVILVIFFFLREWRTTLIPIVVIPIALIGSFFIMYLAGFSINVLTLLAIVLAIGLVVDDAIVVLENIYAKMEAGMSPIEAGINGTREIFFAVIATTLALVAVFMPIIFLGGLTGRLFREFGVMIAGSVLISSFVALTLTPMLSTRILRREHKPGRFYQKTEPGFRRLSEGYRARLQSFMRRRWYAVALMMGCGGLAWLLFSTLPAELAPMEDRSRFSMMASAPEGASYEYMDDYINRLAEHVRQEVPELESVVTVTAPGFGAAGSVNSGFVRAMLVPPAERDRTQNQIAQSLTRSVQQLPGARTFVSQDQTISVGRMGGLPIQYVLQAPDIERLREALPPFLDQANQHPAFAFADVDLKFNKPELRVNIDRDRAQSMGVSVAAVAQTLQLALSEQRIGYFIRNGKQYQVIAQVDRDYRGETLDLKSLYVRSAGGQQVALDNLVEVTEESSPPQLYRFNRYTSATISAELAPGYTMDDGIDAMNEIAAGVLDPSFATSLTGPTRDFVESSSSLLYVFLLAIVLVYLVLAAQFESFRDPLTILLTVPLALTGALVSLWYFGQTINIFSQIGLVMLIGLVTKNGILIVEFANQRRAAGLGIVDAVVDAAVSRFRPILMTTLSTVLGILPIALALGAGSESRIPMGVAVIGGLLIGTLLSLFVVPVMYTFLTGKAAHSTLAGLTDEGRGDGSVDGAPVPTTAKRPEEAVI